MIRAWKLTKNGIGDIHENLGKVALDLLVDAGHALALNVPRCLLALVVTPAALRAVRRPPERQLAVFDRSAPRGLTSSIDKQIMKKLYVEHPWPSAAGCRRIFSKNLRTQAEPSTAFSQRVVP